MRYVIDSNNEWIFQMFGAMEDTVFCGVFDGHGPHGHVVAKKVRDCFPLKIMEEWISRRRDDDNDGKTNNNNKDDILKMMRELFLMASKFVDKELKLHYAMESYGSGTTAVTLIKKVCMLFHFVLSHFHGFKLHMDIVVASIVH